jgi:hypothetical protein
MGLPAATTKSGIAFAFPNVCNTPSPGGLVPIPYPSIGQLNQATGANSVIIGGSPVITSASTIASTTGDAAATTGTISGQPVGGPVEFNVTFSLTVLAEGNNVVRMSDTTRQNNGNCFGQVLGGEPTVLVG